MTLPPTTLGARPAGSPALAVDRRVGPSPIPSEIQDKIGVLAQLVLTGGDRLMTIDEARGSVAFQETRERLSTEFSALAVTGRTADEAYLELRKRHAPSYHLLLNLPCESPPDLFFNTGSESNPEWRPDRIAFVEMLTRESRFAAPSDTFTSRGYELLLYSGGVYREGAVGHLHARIEAAFAARRLTATNSFIEETIRSVARRSAMPRSSFNPAGFLNLENGVFDLESHSLRPHSPARRFTWQIPIRFDKAAACPKFDRFLDEVLPSERSRREIQKLFAYALCVRGNPYQCSHLLYGEGNNGKSTLLSVLSALLGKENVSAETLQTLTENRFSTAKLWGKLANVFADLPANPLRYTSLFKALTGGDEVRGEYKFGSIFYFVCSAKLVFSANELPEVNDRTLAFWRRWFLIRFDHDFSHREDRQLLGRLLQELPGVLNFALGGVKVLEEDKGFLSELGTEDLLSEWRKFSDNLGWFVAERIRTDPTGWVAKNDFYETYSEFCGSHGTAAKAPENVGKEIARHIPSVRTQSRRLEPGGPQIRGWRGVRIRPEQGDPASPDSPVSADGRTPTPDAAEAAEAGESGEAGDRPPEQLPVLGVTASQDRPQLTPEVDLARWLRRFGLGPWETFPDIRFHRVAGDPSRLALVSRRTAKELGRPWVLSDPSSVTGDAE